MLLAGIQREMGDTPLARFEIETLEFIRDTQPPTSGFEIDILALTVLTQDIVYPSDEQDGERRKLTSDVALQVQFRTVGVVTHGIAPSNLNFTDITDEGFKNHFNEYLYRLYNADPFFEPLHAIISQEDMVQEEPEQQVSKAQFIAAILFSTVAFILPICASYYAIRKHLKNQKRIKDKSHMLEYPGYEQNIRNGTQSFSDSDETEENRNKALQLEINHGHEDLEDVGLSPSAMASPFNGCTPIPEESVMATPKSQNRFSETSANIKKWLTPRLSMFTSTPQSMVDNSRFDPPDSEVSYNVGAKPSRQSMEPDALKASTANQNGVLSEEKQTIGGKVKSKVRNQSFTASAK